MENNDIKIIFVDLDGTLTTTKDKHNLFIEDKLALKRAQKAGIYVVITTGRSRQDVKKIWNQLYLDFHADIVSYSNGSVIENLKTGEIIVNELIEKDDFSKLIEYIFEHKNWYFKLTNVKNLFKTSKMNFIDKFITKKEIIKIQDDFNNFKIDYTKNLNKVGIFHSFSKKETTKTINDLKQKFPNLEIVTSGSKGIYIEITNKGVNKGKSALEILGHLNIEPSNAMAIGDSMNDYSIFKVVNFSVAMKNADDNLKEVAKYETDTVKNKGVSKILEKYI